MLPLPINLSKIATNAINAFEDVASEPSWTHYMNTSVSYDMLLDDYKMAKTFQDSLHIKRDEPIYALSITKDDDEYIVSFVLPLNYNGVDAHGLVTAYVIDEEDIDPVLSLEVQASVCDEKNLEDSILRMYRRPPETHQLVLIQHDFHKKDLLLHTTSSTQH